MKESNTLRLLTFSCIATFALTLSTYSATERVSETFPLKSSGSIRLANVNGRVDVRTGDGEGAKLVATKEGRNDEIVEGIQIFTESTADRLVIKVELPKVKRGWWRGSSREGKVDFLLTVPAGATLENIATVNGPVEIHGIQGSVHATSVNGSIRCLSLGGTTILETVNGSVYSEHRSLDPGARLQASSVNGAIEVQLPEDLSAVLEASTVNGSVRSDFPFTTTTKNSRRSVEARIGEGGARLDLSTVNGGIRIRESRDEHANAE